MKITSCKQWMGMSMLASALFMASCTPEVVVNDISLLPLPTEVQQSEGAFILKNGAQIGFSDSALQPAAEYLAEMLSTATGFTIHVTEGKGDISLESGKTGEKVGAYALRISEGKVEIKGNGYAGVIAGIETLRQLFPAEIESDKVVSGVDWAVPNVSITDVPRYEWRGLMLDVSRHFYDKNEVKELLDLMALYKMNKFHWHLTDDQGWRVEIKKYPLLTEKGAWRTFNKHDRGCMKMAKEQDNTDFNIPTEKLRIEKGDTLYGGYYTPADIKDIVSYAAVRGIDVIPEIDMPGHMLAAVGNYEGLACNDKVGWGSLFSSPLCPGKDKAISFCKDVYKEIFELFPYKYVHIGGDEVDKTNWKKCPDCQSRMRKHHLKSEAALQSWFNHEMEAYFNANGKEMIGWDEIIEGGLSETSTVMWWRSWSKDASKKATAHGNKVIYTPNAPFYLDYQQDKKSVINIYKYNPELEGMTDAQKELIMGVQGNIWCEWIPSRERMLYMAAPRMLAIAELGWSQNEKDWEYFRERLANQFERLNVMNINYRIPDLEGFKNENVFIGEGAVGISCLDPSATIRYTTDGSIPTESSPIYSDTIRVNETTAFTFRTFRANGKKGDIVKTRFTKGNYAPAVKVAPSTPGLKAVWHEYRGNNCNDITTGKKNGTYNIEDVMIPAQVKGNIGLVITGYLNAPKDDVYSFTLLSDDGSILKIDNEVVVDNDGPHAPRELISEKALKAGYHPIEINYFDHNGGTLKLQVAGSDGKVIPFTHLYAH